MKQKWFPTVAGFWLTAASPCVIQASPFTWNGGGTNDDWSTPANWGGGAPSNNGSATTRFAGSVRTTPNVDAAWSVLGVEFLAGASAFTVGGSAVTIGTGGISQNASNPQTLTTPIVVNGSQSWSSSGAKLVIGSTSITTDTITLGSNQLTFTGSGDHELHGVVSGTGSLVKSGAGTLTITPAQSFSGGFSILGGTVDIGGSFNRLGTGTVTLNGGTLRTDNPTNLNQAYQLGASGGTFESLGGTPFVSGKISGPGQLIKTGPAKLRISNNTNDYSGGTLVSQGTLEGSGTSLKGPVTTHGTVEFSNASTYANGTISGSGNVLKSGTGLLSLQGVVNIAGSFTISGGDARVEPDQSLSASSVSVAAGSSVLTVDRSLISAQSLDLGAGSTLAFDAGGNFLGVGSFQSISGTGTVNLNTSSNAGNLTLTHNADITTGITFTGGSEFGSRGLVKQGTGILTLTANNSGLEYLHLANGGLRFSAANQIGQYLYLSGTPVLEATAGINPLSIGMKLEDAPTIDTGGHTLGLSGVLSGSGSLTKTGTGTLVLTNNANSYSGGTTVSQGALQASGTALRGNISNQGVVEFTAPSTYENGTITGSGTVRKSGGGMLSLAGSVNITGPFELSGGDARVEPEQTLSTSSISVAAGSSVLTVDRSVISAQSLDLGAGGTLAFDAGGNFLGVGSFQSISGTGTVNLNTSSNAGNLTLTHNADITTGITFTGGSEFGSRGLVKQGTGILTLTANNSGLEYLHLANGGLRFSAANQIGQYLHLSGTSVLEATAGINPLSIGMRIEDTPTIDTGSFNLTLPTPPVGNGSMTKLGTGTLAIDLGPFTTLPTMTVSAGALRLYDGTLAATEISNAATVELAGVSLQNASITGTGAVRVSGSGATLLFGGNSLQASSITVESGAFNINQDSVSTALATLAAGTMVSLTGDGFTSGSLIATELNMAPTSMLVMSGAGGVPTMVHTQKLTGGGSIVFGSDDGSGMILDPSVDLTLPHSFSGGSPIYQSGLVKKGASNLTLTGNNSMLTYLEIQGGTLFFSGQNPLGGRLNLKNTSTLRPQEDGMTLPTALEISGASVIDTAGFDLAFTAPPEGSGTLSKQGGGMLSFNLGAFTLLPETTVAAGALRLLDGTLAATQISNHGTVELSGVSLQASSITGTGAVRVSGTGAALTFAGNSIQASSITVDNGVLNVMDGTVSSTTMSFAEDVSGIVKGGFDYNGSLVAGELTMASGSSLRLKNEGGFATANVGIVTGSGALQIDSGCTMTLGSGENSVGVLNGQGTLALGSAHLTIGVEDQSSFFSGNLTGSGGITKVGGGILSMSAPQYTGATHIDGGILELGAPGLSDSAAVRIAEFGVLHLDFTGEDTVAALYIDGVLRPSGTWGAIGSAADYESPRFAGFGLLRVVSQYDIWIEDELSEGMDAGFHADPDGDLIPNGIEFVLGSKPGIAETGAARIEMLPTFVRQGDTATFTFRRTHRSAYLNPSAEISINLQDWSIPTPPQSGVSIQTNFLNAETDLVSVTFPIPTVPPNDQPSPRCFGRLAVSGP